MSIFDNVIDRKNTYCTQWDFVKDRFGVEGLLPFTISDMDFQSPQIILDAFTNRVKHGVFGYTRWNNPDYLNAISTWYFKRFNYKINQDWISYSPSVIYSLSKLLHILNPNQENVLIFSPCYDGFLKVIKSNQYPMLNVDISKNIENSDFEEKIAKSRVLVLCNPNNPNGKLWRKEELHYIVSLCKKNNVFIISDDIHMDIVYKPHKFTPLLKVAESLDYLENSIIITSSSKTFNTAGVGGSYALIPNSKVRNNLTKIIKEQDSVNSAMIFSIVSTIEGYNNCEDWLEELVSYCYNNLRVVDSFLKKSLPILTMQISQSTYFAWIDCTKLNLSNEEIQNKLIHKGKVAIMGGNTYLMEDSYLRLNLACPLSKLQDGLERIKISLT